jgi:hypothetical protein
MTTALPQDTFAPQFISHLNEAEIQAYCESLVGEPFNSPLIDRYEDVHTLAIPESNTLLLEFHGGARRLSKQKHYSIEIGPNI